MEISKTKGITWETVGGNGRDANYMIILCGDRVVILTPFARGGARFEIMSVRPNYTGPVEQRGVIKKGMTVRFRESVEERLIKG